MIESPQTPEESSQALTVDDSRRTSHAVKSVLIALLTLASAVSIVYIDSLIPNDWRHDGLREVVINWSFLTALFALGFLLVLGISQALRAFQTNRESKVIGTFGMGANLLLAIPVAAQIALIFVEYLIWPKVDGVFLINGQPVSQAELFLWDIRSDPYFRNGLSGETDEDGTFRFYGLWPAEYELSAEYNVPVIGDPSTCRENSGDYELSQFYPHGDYLELRITPRKPLTVTLLTRNLPSYFIEVVCE